MKEIYSVQVLMHPLNHKGCFEILFSYDGQRYSTVDGNSPEYFKECGLTTACRFEVTPMQFYKLMAKSLASKLRMVDLHIRYKDSVPTMKMFKALAEKCVNAQCKYSEDLDIPEVVVTMANSRIICPIHH